LDPVVATELGILQLFLSDNDNAVHLIIWKLFVNFVIFS
jgi:hypothetical protein